MPIYDFTCQECGEQSEVLVRGESQPECPRCGSERMTRLLPLVASPSRDANAAGGDCPSGGSCGAA